MYLQRVFEVLFTFFRLIGTYGVVFAFLAAPPVVNFTQRITDLFVPVIPDLTVSRTIPESQQFYATQDAVKVVWLGESSELFPSDQHRHLIDVHNLIIWGSFLVGCAVILAILIENTVNKERIAKYFVLTARTIVAVTLLAAVVFPWSFELFHTVVFPQGNYAFSADSLLIQSFPPVFWLVNFLLLQSGVVVLLWLQSRYAQKSVI